MNRAPSPLVSIVTPVYNEEQYLPECIESVQNQTYRNWEYTIVDNCSTDASPTIARKFATKDSRIRVVENRQFLKPLPNLNHALRLISTESKYCKVVFGDDWIYPECLERMVAAAEAHPSAGIVGAYALEGTRVVLTGLPYRQTLISGREVCRHHLLERQYVFGTQNSVLYRADLVRARESLFNEENLESDTEVCFDLLRSSDFAFVHQVLTYTRVREGSLYARSVALETSWAAILHLLTTYGPFYLTDAELQRMLRSHLSSYYRFLGKNMLLRRDALFWSYHKSQLINLGVGYSRGRVAAGLLATLASAMLNPGRLMDRLSECWNVDEPSRA
jgi:glycosyltransferase involved in cell wall biosynthesis